MKPSLYIDEKGVVKYIPYCPEEPGYIETTIPTMRENVLLQNANRRRKYERALTAAKDSAIEVTSHTRDELLRLEVIGPHNGIYPIPEGWRVEVREELEYPIDHTSYPPYIKVAVLIPPPTSEQKPKGLYGKYIIQKANGKPIDPEAEFFVLRLDPLGEMNHVKACRKAVQVYADEIEPYLPELAKDLRERYPSPPHNQEQNRV